MSTCQWHITTRCIDSHNLASCWHKGRAWHAIGLSWHIIAKSNEYKFVAFTTYTQQSDDIMRLITPPKAAVYTIGCDSWKEVDSLSLEAKTTLVWPDRFLMCLKGMCFWLGIEQDKEISVYDTFDDPEGGRLIISFDTSREVFHGIPEPSVLQRLPLGCDLDLKLIVWNESVALFALFFENHQKYRYPKPDLFEMWVMDDNSKCAWTKQLTISERTECPPEMFPQTYHIFFSRPVALWSVEFLMVHNDGRVVCFNLCTKKLTYIPTETRGEFVGYVNSIVSVMGHNHKLESIENNCSDKDEGAMVAVEGKAAGGGTHIPFGPFHRLMFPMESRR